MNPVIHFEMPADDRERMVKFYSGVFGWQAQMFGPELGNYVTVSTIDTGPDGRPTKPGGINGGFYPKSNDAPVTSVVIGVDDIKAHAKKVAAAGGKILGEPIEIPGIGWYVSFIDTEGNRLSMLQPS